MSAKSVRVHAGGRKKKAKAQVLCSYVAISKNNTNKDEVTVSVFQNKTWHLIIINRNTVVLYIRDQSKYQYCVSTNVGIGSVLAYWYILEFSTMIYIVRSHISPLVYIGKINILYCFDI